LEICGTGKGEKRNPYGKYFRFRQMTPDWVVFMVVLRKKGRPLTKNILL